MRKILLATIVSLSIVNATDKDCTEECKIAVNNYKLSLALEEVKKENACNNILELYKKEAAALVGEIVFSTTMKKIRPKLMSLRKIELVSRDVCDKYSANNIRDSNEGIEGLIRGFQEVSEESK